MSNGSHFPIPVTAMFMHCDSDIMCNPLFASIIQPCNKYMYTGGKYIDIISVLRILVVHVMNVVAITCKAYQGIR